MYWHTSPVESISRLHPISGVAPEKVLIWYDEHEVLAAEQLEAPATKVHLPVPEGVLVLQNDPFSYEFEPNAA